MLRKCFINILILMFLTTSLYAKEKKIINFSPLPINSAKQNIQDFIPLNSYLEEKLNIKIKYVQFQNYQDIINSFKQGKIDIAYLGPLLLTALQKQYPYIQPIVSLKQNNGSSKYRCVLTKFKKDIIDKTHPINIALTQPLSTCGYYMTKKLLQKNLSLELNNQHYSYKMSHSNAILSVLEGKSLIAGVKDTVAEQYQTVGMEIIAKSDPLPGFAFVANLKTLSQTQIKQFKDTLLHIEPSKYKNWGHTLSSGFITTDLEEYNTIDINSNEIPLQGNTQ